MGVIALIQGLLAQLKQALLLPVLNSGGNAAQQIVLLAPGLGLHLGGAYGSALPPGNGGHIHGGHMQLGVILVDGLV